MATPFTTPLESLIAYPQFASTSLPYSALPVVPQFLMQLSLGYYLPDQFYFHIYSLICVNPIRHSSTPILYTIAFTYAIPLDSSSTLDVNINHSHPPLKLLFLLAEVKAFFSVVGSRSPPPSANAGSSLSGGGYPCLSSHPTQRGAHRGLRI